MTTLREAAQQALEALEERYVGALRDKAMDALKAALAEPVEPAVAWNKGIRDSVDLLLAQAGYQPDSSARHQLAMMKFDTPPQRKPLTREEVDQIWESERAFSDIYAITRAIEAALKEKNHEH